MREATHTAFQDVSNDSGKETLKQKGGGRESSMLGGIMEYLQTCDVYKKQREVHQRQRCHS